MSIQKLSAALGDRFITYLSGDKNDLSSLSRVNKYYHTLAEPHLYRSLSLYTDEEDRIKRLLLTIVRQPGLARHVKSIEVTSLDHVMPIANFIPVSKAVHKVARGQGIEFATKFLKTVLDETQGVDGALALIICLSGELEELALRLSCDDRLPFTLEIMGAPWWRSANLSDAGPGLGRVRRHEGHDDLNGDVSRRGNEKIGSELGKEHDSQYPLEKLKVLRVHARDDLHDGIRVPVGPSLYEIHLSCLSSPCVVTDFFISRYSELRCQLTTLSLEEVSLDSDELVTMLAHPEFASLRVLRVSGLVSEDLDPAQLSDTIATHLTHLEEFEWKDDDLLFHPRCAPLPFGSFKSCTNLRVLEVSCLSLHHHIGTANTPWNMVCEHLTMPDEFLPPGLEHLCISNIPCEYLDELVFHYTSAMANTQSLDMITQLAAMRPFLKSLHLVIHAVEYLPDFEVVSVREDTIEYLASMANALEALGIEFRFWRHELGGRVEVNLERNHPLAVPLEECS